MSYNILNKNVQFQGTTQGTIEDIVDTHSNQAITGSKDFNTLTGSSVHVGHILSIGTHANDHAICIAGDISGSGNISGSAFYGDGSNLTGVGGTITALNDQAANRLVTIGATTTELDGEENLTFDGSVLVVAGNIEPDVDNTRNLGSASKKWANIYGVWSGDTIDGGKIELASGGGITDSTGLTLTTSGLSNKTSPVGSDKIWIDDGAVKYATITNIFANNAAVTSFSDGASNRVVTAGGASSISGQANLTFDGSELSVTGDVSGSGDLQIGGDITGSAISLVDASSLAGSGLSSLSGQLEVQVSDFMSSGSNNRILTAADANTMNAEANLQFDGTILSINGAEGGAGVYSKIVIRKTGIADNSATAVVRFTIPNANHAAGFKVFGFVTTDSGSRVGTFEQDIAISRVAGSIAAHAGINREESARANSGGSGGDFTISTDLTQSGAASASNTLDYELTIDTTDGSSTNAVIYVELLNFNSTGITMAAV